MYISYLTSSQGLSKPVVYPLGCPLETPISGSHTSYSPVTQGRGERRNSAQLDVGFLLALGLRIAAGIFTMGV